MPANYLKNDPTFGRIDLDDEYITDSWLVDQFVGNNLFAFGGNAKGELGQNFQPLVNQLTPFQIGSLINWKQASGGGQMSSYVKTDGTLWTCGYNLYGQLGNGTVNISYSSPIQVGSSTTWKQVSSSYPVAAVKTDGTLWTWGYNGTGCLGNGTITNYSSPIQVGSLTNWKQVSVKGFTVSAIKTDGTLWTWGQNTYGQLGNGNVTNYSSPIQVGSLTNWKKISKGGLHLAAIKIDGTLWTCGYNLYGQLGNSTSINYSSPVQVGSLTNWSQISCGYHHTAAIKTDGSLWTWGYNSVYGQLGNGTIVNYSSPIQVGSLTNWNQLGCGYYTLSAIKKDGTLWVWGANNRGQLGNNTNISYSSPIQVGSLTNWKFVAGGQYHTLSTTFADIT